MKIGSPRLSLNLIPENLHRRKRESHRGMSILVVDTAQLGDVVHDCGCWVYIQPATSLPLVKALRGGKEAARYLVR